MPLKNCTLLFVEDNLDSQEQVKMLLEDEVKEFYQAYDAKEGLKIYEEKIPDIVITDINLPFYSGLELTAKIKDKKREQPIIIMSAYDNRETLLDAINLGSAGFIPKPMDIDLLFEKLYEIAYRLNQQVKQNKKITNKIEKLSNLAYFDSLTQLPNKFMFEKELTSFIKEAETENIEFALFFIDIDNFKTINDEYGHGIGDYILKSITSKISKVISSDDLLARRSGDEFLILLKNYISIEDIKKIANNILQFTSEKIICKDCVIKPSCSIGISQFPKNSIDKDELLTLADTAMYHAKELGKGKYSFVDDIIQDVEV